jgi:hypothetical protein
MLVLQQGVAGDGELIVNLSNLRHGQHPLPAKRAIQ